MGSLQFSIPTDINDFNNIIDQHGQYQPSSTFLDILFDYIDIDAEGINGINNTESTPMLTEDLKRLLVLSYSQEERNNRFIEYYNECKDDDDDDRADLCEMQLEILVEEQEKFAMMGLSRLQLDDSVTLIFGNKTTLGQICAYSRGLIDDLIDDTPGFCCLDAPYESKEWGEIVSTSPVNRYIFACHFFSHCHSCPYLKVYLSKIRY